MTHSKSSALHHHNLVDGYCTYKQCELAKSSDVEDLRNLKYKGATMTNIQAWLNIHKLKATPIDIEVLANAIHRDTLEIMDARQRRLIETAVAEATKSARIDELKRLHRLEGYGLPKRDYDNRTDELIDDRLEVLQMEWNEN